jgi:uncharacterized protein
MIGPFASDGDEGNGNQHGNRADVTGQDGYRAYFECFNAGQYYEAHDALEAIWLPLRNEPDGAFYKGLIQLAGAFVHVRKERYAPAMALLRRARYHLEPYPALHHGLSLPEVLRLIDRWLERLGVAPPAGGNLGRDEAPQLSCGGLAHDQGG